MIRALLLAIAQLSDPASRRVVWIGVLSAVAAFGLLAGTVWWALFHTVLTDYAWVDRALDLLGGLAVLVLAWLLFPATVGMVSSFFLDEVVRAVERRHYPHLPPARQTGIAEELGLFEDGVNMSNEFRFFIYLLERYAEHLGVSADVAYRRLAQKGLVDYAVGMYELYHVEAIENAFADLDKRLSA